MDLVHPNYQATKYVLDKFMEYFVAEDSQKLAEEIQKIVIARKHKPFQSATEAHKRFLQSQYEKTSALYRKYPFLSLHEELEYFSRSNFVSAGSENAPPTP
jgi:hypothetical protein